MSNRRLWWATLARNSRRYEDWRNVLGSDDVPLTSPGSGVSNLEGVGDTDVYLVDLAQLSAEQFDRLVLFCAKKFHADPAQVRDEIQKVGFPIRATDVVVAFDMRAFL